MIVYLVSFTMFWIIVICAYFSIKAYKATEPNHAISNRVVVWHQNILKKPAEQRTQEMQKLKEYVKNIPEIKPLNVIK